jgi:hypothetical protein
VEEEAAGSGVNGRTAGTAGGVELTRRREIDAHEHLIIVFIERGNSMFKRVVSFLEWWTFNILILAILMISCALLELKVWRTSTGVWGFYAGIIWTIFLDWRIKTR